MIDQYLCGYVGPFWHCRNTTGLMFLSFEQIFLWKIFHAVYYSTNFWGTKNYQNQNFWGCIDFISCQMCMMSKHCKINVLWVLNWYFPENFFLLYTFQATSGGSRFVKVIIFDTDFVNRWSKCLFQLWQLLLTGSLSKALNCTWKNRQNGITLYKS